MRKSQRLLLKAVSGVVGFPLLLAGIVLIPLPGPGVLTCLVALFVLSLGFDWPKPYLIKMKIILKKVISEARARADALDDKWK